MRAKVAQEHSLSIIEVGREMIAINPLFSLMRSASAHISPPPNALNFIVLFCSIYYLCAILICAALYYTILPLLYCLFLHYTGNSGVIAAVYGPLELGRNSADEYIIEGQIVVQYKRPSGHQQQRNSRDAAFDQMLTDTVTGCVLAKRFPRCALHVVVQVTIYWLTRRYMKTAQRSIIYLFLSITVIEIDR